MGIEASYRRITPQEWAKLQDLLDDFESLDPLERYEALPVSPTPTSCGPAAAT
jgi:hypothetical protein